MLRPSVNTLKSRKATLERSLAWDDDDRNQPYYDVCSMLYLKEREILDLEARYQCWQRERAEAAANKRKLSTRIPSDLYKLK